MKSIYKNIIIVIILAIGAFACDKEHELELNDDVDFCSCLNLEDIHKTIPLVNDFLAELPDSISEDQTYESLETWLNSCPCNVDAKILNCIDLVWGGKTTCGVSIVVRDSDIMREIRLDFAIIDHALTYSQIAGYVYYKQNAIHVKTKSTDIDKVFDFINLFDLDVKEIKQGIYLSSMPADEDTLQYIINNLKAKPYTSDTWISGRLNGYNANIAISIRLYDMHNTNYQADWKETMNEYKLKSYRSGPEHIIVFYIPEGTGEQWETSFTEYDFVDWAELSFTRYTIR